MRIPSTAIGLIAAGCQEYEIKPGLGNDLPTTSGGSTTAQSPPTNTTTPPVTTGDPGTPPLEVGENTDVVVVPTEYAVDVLWVIDNSSSMGDNQAALSAESPTFIDYFVGLQGVDWHIGVVSTDVEDPNHSGKLQLGLGLRWLDPASPDPYGAFAQMALLGTGGSGDEAGRAATDLALGPELNASNAGFVRDDATIAVIVISDEPDSSDLFGVGIQPFIDTMRAFKPDPANFTMSAIAGPVPAGCPGANPGTGYPEVVSGLGGLFWSICDPDWDTVLSSLAVLALGGRQEFFLTEVPVVETLSVQVIEPDGTEVWLTQAGVDFAYDPVRNSVTLLLYTPQPLAEVYVHYDVDWGALP